MDQLLDLLERHGATHVAALTRQPLRLLMATLPELPAASDPEIALAGVVRRGQSAATRFLAQPTSARAPIHIVRSANAQ